MESIKLFRRKPINEWKILLWWEYRRVFYNMIMLGVGLICTYICSRNYPELSPDVLLSNVAIYALGANLFYTTGSLFEFLFRSIGYDRIQGFSISKVLLGIGIIGSILLSMGITLLSFHLPYERFFL